MNLQSWANAPGTEHTDDPGPGAPRSLPPRPERLLSLREELSGFLGQLERLVSRQPAAVQLTGPRGGEGASTLTRELARCAASGGTSVLLVQLPHRQPAPSEDGSPAPATPAPTVGLDALEAAVYGLSSSSPPGRPAELLLSPEAVAALRDSNLERERLVSTLKERFALVLVDAPPVLTGSDGLLLAPVVDGVVLVVEAEVTRRPVAQAATERIRDTGATLVGLLFNKRRHHIPDAVYRLL